MREGLGEGAAPPLRRIGQIRFGRYTHCAQAELPPNPDCQTTDCGMQMHVLVGVQMVQPKAGGREGGELRTDFGRELAAGTRAEEVGHTEPKLRGRELAVGVNDVRNSGGGQHRRSLDRHQMQSDGKGRQRLGPPHRVRRGGSSDHQAGGGEHAVAVRPLHRLVDQFRQTEIVGGDDEPLQAALWRSRRNWKNSTPSRSRRFIICGLRAISPTIAAIFGARK